MVLGPAVRGTTGPRTTCPGGQFFGGTSGPATPAVASERSIFSKNHDCNSYIEFSVSR